MLQLKEFLETKKLPSFLTQNKVLLSFDKVDKIFPKIGLVNSTQECVLDNSKIVIASAINFISAVHYIFEEPGRILLNYSAYMPTKKITKEQEDEIYYLGNLFDSVRNQIGVVGYRLNDLIINDNGKISIKLRTDILDLNNEVIFKANESLFKVYTKLYKSLQSLKCGVTIEKLDTMPEFKRFSSDNLPQDRFQIVFSSDGVEGLWDISTMSMRGITSCQSWDGQYKNNLVGSIVDPFTAIIYITSGTDFNRLGTKMVKRSVVRFLIDKDKKPFILVDKIYPEFDQEVLDKFISFIKEKVNNKFDVVFGPTFYSIEGCYIPSSSVHSKLTKSTTSYRDTEIPFKFEKSVATLFDKNLKVRKNKFINLMKNSAYEFTYHDNLFLKVKKPEMQSFIDKNVSTPDFKFLVRDYYADIASAAINNLSSKDILTSKEYMKKLCFYYLNNKEICSKSARSSCVKKINEYFKASSEAKMNSKLLTKILSKVQLHVEGVLKSELKKLIIGKANSKSKTSN